MQLLNISKKNDRKCVNNKVLKSDIVSLGQSGYEKRASQSGFKSYSFASKGKIVCEKFFSFFFL